MTVFDTTEEKELPLSRWLLMPFGYLLCFLGEHVRHSTLAALDFWHRLSVSAQRRAAAARKGSAAMVLRPAPLYLCRVATRIHGSLSLSSQRVRTPSPQQLSLCTCRT